MSEDPSTNRTDSNDQEGGETQQNSVAEEIEDGYKTPTSEEHKIPPVTWTPPPAPRKRKFFFEPRVDVRKVEARIVEEKDLESFFKLIVPRSCLPPSPRPRPPEPEPDRGNSPKRIRTG